MLTPRFSSAGIDGELRAVVGCTVQSEDMLPLETAENFPCENTDSLHVGSSAFPAPELTVSSS